MGSRDDLKILKDGLKGPILEVEDPRKHDVLDILKSYFREILMLARKYSRPTVDYEDLVVEGLMGLMDAVRRWDPEKSTGPKSFHQLAIVRIKSQMFEFFLANSTLYTVPNYMARAMTLVDQVRNLIKSRGREGNEEEILLNFEVGDMGAVMSRADKEQLHKLKERIRNLARSSKRSYEEMVRNVLDVEEAIETYERGEECKTSPEEVIAQKEFLGKFLGLLKPDARDIVALRLQGRTLEEAGGEKGLTRERARQIEEAALKYLLQTRMFMEANN